MSTRVVVVLLLKLFSLSRCTPLLYRSHNATILNFPPFRDPYNRGLGTMYDAYVRYEIDKWSMTKHPTDLMQ